MPTVHSLLQLTHQHQPHRHPAASATPLDPLDNRIRQAGSAPCSRSHGVSHGDPRRRGSGAGGRTDKQKLNQLRPRDVVARRRTVMGAASLLHSGSGRQRSPGRSETMEQGSFARREHDQTGRDRSRHGPSCLTQVLVTVGELQGKFLSRTATALQQ